MEKAYALKINEQLSRIEIDSFELEDPLVFKYFSGVKKEERNSTLARAIRIGVLALMEDRISAFFARTTNDLKKIEKSMLSIEFDQQYLAKYLQDGTMTKEDFLDFYMRDEIRTKFQLISKDIDALDKED